MPPLQSWLDSKTGATPEEVRDGDGCHPDETHALSDYLSGLISKQEAAKRITAPILSEMHPSKETYRLWGLLSDALVELSVEDRYKTLDLLSEIQALPSTKDIQWARLPGFANMWADLNRLHYHGQAPWEKDVELLDSDRVDELRGHFESVGDAEGQLFVRGFDMVTDDECACDILDLIHSDRPGLDILMSKVFGFLNVAGWKVKENAGRPESPLAKNWVSWKEAMLRLSQGDSTLTEVGRANAARCYGLM